MRPYFNEFDRFPAAWLRALYPSAEVDERSIADVGADDLAGRERCHFFAGIGGWEYALELAGWPADWPVWTGSCPCQPFSAAGKGLGEKDPRHLWPEFRRLIALCRPPVVFGEQVASKAGRLWLAGVRADMEALGYAFGAADLCAAGVGAPHIRQRLYWVAYRHGRGLEVHPQQHRKPKERSAVRNPCRGYADGCGDASGVGYSDEPGPQRHRPVGRDVHAGALNGHASETALQPHGLAHSVSERGRGGPSEERNAADARAPGASGGPDWRNAWSDGETIYCRDGRTRRIGAGVCPLAHGIPGRVGQLRGYGNAIVPQVAAAFVSAFMEAL